MADATLPELLRENLEYLEQLKASYRSDEDLAKLRNVRGSFAEAVEICREREKDVRETIKGRGPKQLVCKNPSSTGRGWE